MTAISYNSNSLQTDNITTSDIEHGWPSTIMAKYPVANGNRSKFNFPYYPDRVVSISGSFEADTIAEADDLEDELRAIFTGFERPLDIEYGSGTRRYTATPEPNTVNIQRPGGLMWGTFSVQFACSIPFGIDIDPINLASVSGHTAATLTTNVDLLGSAKYQYPMIKVTVNSGSAMTPGTISIGNGLNGQTVMIERNWSPTDELIIDPFNILATVNGIEVGFDGAIPIFSRGTNIPITYEDDFLTRNVDIEIEYYRCWM